MQIHWSSVQIFQTILAASLDQFAKFDEIHSNPSPKILRKIRQPLGALRGHLTKSQPQEKFSPCQIHSVEHLQCTVYVRFSQIQLTVAESLSFSSVSVVDLASARRRRVSCPLPLVLCTDQ